MKYKNLCVFLCTLISFNLNAEIPYSLDTLLNFKQEKTGFLPASYWDGMKWQREETEDAFVEDKDVIAVVQNYARFCENFKTLPPQDYGIAPTESSIPPIIHLIWLGSSIPEKTNSAFNSWEKHHPGWEIKIWTDKELVDFPWSTEHVRQAFVEGDTWAEKADVLRLELLYKFGGIYSDADVVCLNSFHDLIVQDIGFFSCFELNYIGKHYGQPFFVGSAVMGAAKGSHVVRRCLEDLQTAKEAPTVGIIKRTGPGLISRSCQAVLASGEENILILPCSSFYALPWKKKEVDSESVLEYVSPESLAIHLWDGSWCTHKKKKK